MPELIGNTLGRFQILERLGKDPWGDVYKAYDPKLDRTVAIQILDPRLAKDGKLDEYFLQMGRNLLGLRNPGIIRIFDLGQTEAMAFIVREFIPGESLRQLLQIMHPQNKWLGLAEAVQLAIQVSRTLEYAHHRGVVHGDLQPGNILLRSEPSTDLCYQPVLINLGFYRPGMTILPSSDPVYQAPEVARGSRFDSRADIYSMGVLLYELVTAQLPKIPAPIRGNTGPLSQTPNLPLLSLRPGLPDSLKQIILKSLALNPHDRFVDAASLTKALVSGLPLTQSIETPPQGILESVSLESFFQQEHTEANPAGPEPGLGSGDTALSATKVNQDKIHILEPDTTLRSASLTVAGLTIGRGKENGIVIDHPSVSRHHVRIDFNGENYVVSDLNSLNGTFLEEVRLLPETPKVWLPGENLRIGAIWLRLERAEQSSSTKGMFQDSLGPTKADVLPATKAMLLYPGGRPIDPKQMVFSPGIGRVGAFSETLNLSVSPGGSVNTSILVINRGPATDIFQITLDGIPQDWIANLTQAINLPAGGQREIQFTFRPPRSPQTRAGRYSVTARLASQSLADQFVDLRITLTVAAFSHFSSELRPKQVPFGKLGQVLVNNLGNLPETFTLRWEGKSFELSFEPSIIKINVPSGQSAAVEFRSTLVQPRWFGGPRPHAFTAHVSSQTGQTQTLQGEYLSRGILPVWTPIVLVCLCLALTCFMVFFYNLITGPSRVASATENANRTLVAAITQQNGQAGASTATFQSGASLVKAQAATATAAWMAADDDHDGLSNGQELQLGTDPEVADSDGDGISDGDEVNIYKTNPLLADTDLDGLNDGTEIQRGSDPLKMDTDGDGLIDSVDPDPLHYTTKTPLIFQTPTPHPTVFFTPVRTPTPTPTATKKATSADISINLSNGQGSSIPGADVTFTLLVTNHGPDAVTGARVTDEFPTVLTNVTWTCVASTGSACRTPNGMGNMNALLDLAVNGTAMLTAKGSLSPTASGLLINSANVLTPEGITDPNPVDNLSIDTDTLTPKVTLTISKTDGRSSIVPGQVDTYTIVVSNNGSSSVSGVSVKDFFPDMLSNITWSCKAAPGSTCSINGLQSGNIDTPVDLNPGGKVTFTANGTLKNSATGILNNTASILSPIDPISNNKFATDTTTIASLADLKIEVLAPITVTAGAPLTYTINIMNLGPSNATNLILTDLLPQGTSLITSTLGTSPCQPQGGKVVCSLSNLASSGAAQILIVVSAPQTPGPIANVVDIKAGEADPNLGNNSATTIVQVK